MPVHGLQSGPELSVRSAAAALRDDTPVETLTRTRLQELARVSARALRLSRSALVSPAACVYHPPAIAHRTGMMARRLAAILAADVVGYSRLMAVDEAGTHQRLKALRKD